MNIKRLETDGIAWSLRRQKRARGFLESMRPGEPGPGAAYAQDWELARKLHYKGLVRPVKPSEAWLPCVLTEAGEAVLLALKETSS